VVARLAHSQVGHNGSVVGLDVNPAMLAAARVATPPELSVEWHHANAESMPFPDSSFDAVLCQMALQFVPDKQAALREMRRVLAPGGRIALNLAGPTPPLFAVLAEVLALRTPEAAGFIHNVFSLHDVTEIRNLMESAGFPDATAESRKVSLCLPPPREFLLQYIHSTPLAGFVMQLNDESRTSMERDAVAHWQSFVKDGALEFTVRVVLVSARK
jgi:ubiquinone/menaquinone biosynthesis C-methylase UbiE